MSSQPNKGGRPRIMKDPRKIHVTLEADDLEWLTTLAWKRRISTAALIREKVAEWRRDACEEGAGVAP